MLPCHLSADISKMYCAIELYMTDNDLHKFVWCSDIKEPVKDYRSLLELRYHVSLPTWQFNAML